MMDEISGGGKKNSGKAKWKGTEKKERIDRDGEEGEGGWEGKKRGMDQ